MKNVIKKMPYALFIGLSLLTLVQILIIFKDTYSESNLIEFTGQAPKEVKDITIQKQESESLSLLNINKASAAEIQELPGIGETYTKKIIDNRPFNSIEDLEVKAGLNANILEQIKDLITYDL